MYNEPTLHARNAARSDLTSLAYHMTKDVKTLISILTTRHLVGSDKQGHISGNKRAVCLQDVPLVSLAETVFYERQQKTARYGVAGLGFLKKYLYKHGARPVIYEDKNSSFAQSLSESEKWRIVHHDLSDPENLKDWTHEREWRLPTDSHFSFDLNETYVILYGTDEYKEFVTSGEAFLRQTRGLLMLSAAIL